MPTTLTYWKKLTTLSNNGWLLNSYMFAHYKEFLRVGGRLPLISVLSRGLTPAILTEVSHPIFLNYVLTFETTRRYKLVGSPITLQERLNFNTNWFDDYEHLHKLLLDQSESKLRLSKVLRLRYRSRRRHTKTTASQKLNYTLSIISRFLIQSSKELRFADPSTGVKIQSNKVRWRRRRRLAVKRWPINMQRKRRLYKSQALTINSDRFRVRKLRRKWGSTTKVKFNKQVSARWSRRRHKILIYRSLRRYRRRIRRPIFKKRRWSRWQGYRKPLYLGVSFCKFKRWGITRARTFMRYRGYLSKTGRQARPLASAARTARYKSFTSTESYYLQASLRRSMASVTTLYKQLRTLTRRLARPKFVYLRRRFLPRTLDTRVKPYLFINSREVPYRPVKSIRLRIRALGAPIAARDYPIHRKLRPRFFPFRQRSGRSRYTRGKRLLVASTNVRLVYRTPINLRLLSRWQLFYSKEFCATKSNTESFQFGNSTVNLVASKGYLTNSSSVRYGSCVQKLTTSSINFGVGLLPPFSTSKYSTISLNPGVPSFLGKLVRISSGVSSKLFIGSVLVIPELHQLTKKYRAFVVKNIGMFLVHHSAIVRKLTYTFESIQVRLIVRQYSFVSKLDEKRRVWAQQRRSVLARIITRSFKTEPSGTRHSYTSAGHNLIRRSMLNTSSKMSINSLFTNLTNHNVKNNNNVWSLINGSVSFPMVMHEDISRSGGFGSSYEFINHDPRIKRIRFKPGYQRIWRQVRTAFQEMHCLRFQYQQRLTRHLIKSSSNHYRQVGGVNMAEATLERTLIFARLAHNMLMSQDLISSSFIFRNGKPACDGGLLVAPNDFIQVVISLRYYLTFRWFTNLVILRLRRIRRLIFRKNKPKKYQASNLRKQISHYVPDWVYYTRYDDFDTKPYLEVDYLTLSAFVLTEPSWITYYRSDDLLDVPTHLSVYRMYNWKYIT